MLPTYIQYKKWSLPAKYSFWGLVSAVAPLLWVITVWAIAVPDYAVLAFNYGTSEMTIYGAAGDSPETAVIIRNANSAEAGVKAEYYWIRRRYPDYRTGVQALVSEPEPGSSRPKHTFKDASTGVSVEGVVPSALPSRYYDVLTIRHLFGRTRRVYFDVTGFWQKPDEPRHDGIGPDEATRQTAKRLKEAIEIEKKKRFTTN